MRCSHLEKSCDFYKKYNIRRNGRRWNLNKRKHYKRKFLLEKDILYTRYW